MQALSPIVNSRLYPQKPSVAFVLSDAGETRALWPVIQVLQQNGVDTPIFASETAKQILSQKGIPTLDNSFQMSQIINGASSVVTGLNSQFQLAWTQYANQLRKPVIGFFDSFNINPLQCRANAFIGKLSTLLTPCEDVSNILRRLFGAIPIVTAGQPILEHPTLALPAKNKTVLFVGSYGATYLNDLKQFCMMSQKLENTNLLISLHPAQSGELERNVVKAFGLENKVTVVPKSVATESLLAAVDCVISPKDSTVAVQAAVQGKPILSSAYNNLENFNLLQQYGIAKTFTDADSLLSGVQSIINKPVSQEQQEASATVKMMKLLKIPTNATQNICQIVLNLISTPTFN